MMILSTKAFRSQRNEHRVVMIILASFRMHRADRRVLSGWSAFLETLSALTNSFTVRSRVSTTTFSISGFNVGVKMAALRDSAYWFATSLLLQQNSGDITGWRASLQCIQAE